MFKKIIAVLAASMGMCGAAAAADLGSYKDGPAPSSSYSPLWAGLYVGGTVGFGTGDTSGSLSFDDYGYPEVLSKSSSAALVDEGGSSLGDLLGTLFSTDYDVNGAIYGAHIGYNWQRGPIVFGVEAAINGTDMDGSEGVLGLIRSERELDWYGTAVGRLGYASGQALFYGFGGVAWGTVETKLSIIGQEVASGETDHVGWTAGAGIEYALNDRWSVRVEYSHVDLGEESFSLGYGVSDEVDMSFDAIKVGASIRFGGSDHLEALK